MRRRYIITVIAAALVLSAGYFFLRPDSRDVPAEESDPETPRHAGKPDTMKEPGEELPVTTERKDTRPADTSISASREKPAKIPADSPVLSWAGDTSIPLRERIKAVEMLGQAGNDNAVGKLFEIARSELYLRYKAIEALGTVRNRNMSSLIDEYLTANLADPDSQAAIAAIRGLAEFKGSRAVPALAAALEANHERKDGYEQEICSTILTMMKEHGDKTAVPHMIAELDMVAPGKWGLGYGNKVISAMSAFSAPDARKAAAEYADRLEKEIPEDPLAKRYYEESIAKARALADNQNAAGND